MSASPEDEVTEAANDPLQCRESNDDELMHRPRHEVVGVCPFSQPLDERGVFDDDGFNDCHDSSFPVECLSIGGCACSAPRLFPMPSGFLLSAL